MAIPLLYSFVPFLRAALRSTARTRLLCIPYFRITNLSERHRHDNARSRLDMRSPVLVSQKSSAGCCLHERELMQFNSFLTRNVLEINLQSGHKNLHLLAHANPVY
jgi:hypothetical protein